MGNGTFTVADGLHGHYALLPAASDSMIALLLRGAQDDTALREHATLAAVLAVNTEANFTNYARKTLSGVSTFLDGGQRVVTWTSQPTAWNPAGGALNNSLAKLLVCYVPTAGAADSAIIPCWHFDFVHQTDGQPLGFNVHPNGAWRSLQQAA